jgi:hypothetical protein
MGTSTIEWTEVLCTSRSRRKTLFPEAMIIVRELAGVRS